MPELPEVESVCRLMRENLLHRRIVSADAHVDEIVFKKIPSSEIEDVVKDATVTGIGRKGKYFWIQLDNGQSLIGHLGMSGWIETLLPSQEAPRFTKLILRTETGGIVITDARRLGRIWFSPDPESDPTIKKLGRDAFRELPPARELHKLLTVRKAPIKAILLDQSFLSGIGNYLADEVLYAAKIAPTRPCSTLTEKETSNLHRAIVKILKIAVDANADENLFPPDWLFHHRWGGRRGADKIGSHSIVRETVAGRTTAWVPSVQK